MAKDDRSARSPNRQELLDRLRDANEQLVVGAMHAQDLADEAAAANRLKDEFLAHVSHELRTPLNAVLGWARLLGGGELDAARALHAIRTIERNSHALTRIIDDLLDVSRILGGNARIEPLPVDLVAVAQGALDQVRFAADAGGVRIAFSAPSAPGPVAGDALRLQQIVANLLANAVKFTPSGGSVALEVRAVGSHAEIEVTDTGLGIDPAFLPSIFDRFTQADASTTRRHGGLGLGLSIVRGLVELHGGTVEAESPGLGHGATFIVRLPILPEIDVVIPVPAAPGPAASRARLDGIRVVLVEDDPDGRHLLTLLLELAGASVTPVASVRDALAAVDAVPPHVIVSDIGLPGEDGFALIRALRTREAEAGRTPLPAVAVTGYVGPEDIDRILAAGFQMHLRKPVEADEIVHAVGALAAQRGG